MKKRTSLFILFFLLASCRPGGDSTYSTRIPNSTSKPFASSQVTNSVGPLTNTPTIRLTPTPTHTPVFSYPTNWPAAFDTPTSIVTPKIPNDNFRLQIWNETDAIELIKFMDEYARDMDVPGPSLSRGSFEWAQRPAELLLQETISRFPNSSNSEAYKWHLAEVRAIIGKRDSDAWIMSQIEKAVQAGDVTIDSLNDFLIPNGFFVKTSTGYNVFGDKKQIWVLQVTLNVGNKGDGLFLIIRQDENLKYVAYKLGSYWSFSNSYSEVYGIGDHNKNGQDEVLLKIGYHSGTMCGSNMRIFEWNESNFVDVTKGKIFYDHCGGRFEFGPNTQDGAATIEITFQLETKPHLQYVWNGQFYVLHDIINSSLWETWKDSVRYKILPYPTETQMLQDLLNSQEIADKGTAYPDYLRYRLGVILALQSRKDEAIDEFQEIISSPADRSHNLYSRMAKLFVELYKDDSTLYRACLATNRLHERSAKSEKYPNGTITILKIEGINLDSLDLTYSTPLCDLDQAFTKTLGTISPDSANLISALTLLGVEIQHPYQADLNMDGSDEWMIPLEHGIWIVVYHQNGKYACVILNDFGFRNGFIKEINDSRILQAPDIGTILFLFRSGSWVWLFGVDDNFQMTYIQSNYNVGSLSLDQIDGIPILQLFPPKGSSKTFWEEGWYGLRWNKDDLEFTNDLLEYQLFSINRPDLANKEITGLIPSYPQMSAAKKLVADPARYYYLAALASELSGNTKNALAIYLQLWHDFPESPYAIMARYKLTLEIP